MSSARQYTNPGSEVVPFKKTRRIAGIATLILPFIWFVFMMTYPIVESAIGNFLMSIIGSLVLTCASIIVCGIIWCITIYTLMGIVVVLGISSWITEKRADVILDKLKELVPD